MIIMQRSFGPGDILGWRSSKCVQGDSSVPQSLPTSVHSLIFLLAYHPSSIIPERILAMHPLNPYLTHKPDFAQLASRHPEFAQ